MPGVCVLGCGVTGGRVFEVFEVWAWPVDEIQDRFVSTKHDSRWTAVGTCKNIAFNKLTVMVGMEAP